MLKLLYMRDGTFESFLQFIVETSIEKQAENDFKNEMDGFVKAIDEFNKVATECDAQYNFENADSNLKKFITKIKSYFEINLFSHPLQATNIINMISQSKMLVKKILEGDEPVEVLKTCCSLRWAEESVEEFMRTYLIANPRAVFSEIEPKIRDESVYYVDIIQKVNDEPMVQGIIKKMKECYPKIKDKCGRNIKIDMSLLSQQKKQTHNNLPKESF